MNPPNPPPLFRNSQEQQLHARENAPVKKKGLFTIFEFLDIMDDPSRLRNMYTELEIEIRGLPEDTPGLAEKRELLSQMLRLLNFLDRQRPPGGGKSRRLRRRSSKKYKKARNSRRHVRS